LSKIAAPTLIINGKQDKIITPVSAQITKSAIKNSRLVLLDGCGHFPFAEQPQQSASAILSFVKELNH
jgi:pimeloyl-ACP methyl ester carboxylesterase